jgi:hypothetical protein
MASPESDHLAVLVDARNFGFKKLSDLVRAQTDLELKTVPGSKGAHLRPHAIGRTTALRQAAATHCPAPDQRAGPA